MTLAELLRAEDDHGVAAFTCEETGIPAWTQIRTIFHRMAISDQLYGTALDNTPRYRTGLRAVTTLARSAFRNRFRRSALGAGMPVCFFTDGIAGRLVDGRWFNRLTDHFALQLPGQTLTIEDQFEWRWQFPRVNERVLLHAPLQASVNIRARLRMGDRHVMRAREFVEFICGRSHRLVGWRPGAEREARLAEILSRKLAALPIQLGAYERLLSRVQPKVLLVLGGAYGPSAALIVAARRRGTATGEFQHGVVSAGHDAYNFAPAILASAAYRATLPEHFLSYGNWWNRQINAPLKMTTIGNPFRIAKLAQLRAGADKKDVVVLSDGSEFSLYLDFATQVAAAVADLGLRVTLRPHPVERSEVMARCGNSQGKVWIDQNVDLYESLTTAHTVITELSTAMFEAVGIADRVFVWNTPKARFMFPTLPFPVAESAASLASHLREGSEGRIPDELAADIWAGDWEPRYRAFLAGHGVSP